LGGRTKASGLGAPVTIIWWESAANVQDGELAGPVRKAMVKALLTGRSAATQGVRPGAEPSAGFAAGQ